MANTAAITAWRAAVTSSPYFSIACLGGSAAVLLGAFGAHALAKHADAKMQATWATAVQYHFYHVLALLFASSTGNDTACKLLTAGTAIFSGSLYALVLSRQKWLGAITPIGGLLMAAGWVALVPRTAWPAFLKGKSDL